MTEPQAVFANNEYYHIYNRGVEKRLIFEDQKDCRRFLQTLEFYKQENPPARFSFRKRPTLVPTAERQGSAKQVLMVEVTCYCLMPNHYHLLVKQLKSGGITKFVSLVSNSYTKYFNTKHKRVGPLFQGTFKAVRVESDEQLTHLSRYIHLNPLVNYVVRDLRRFPFSSYHKYVNEEKKSSKNFLTINPQEVLSNFTSSKDYKKFVLDQEDYAKDLENMKHTLLDA